MATRKTQNQRRLPHCNLAILLRTAEPSNIHRRVPGDWGDCNSNEWQQRTLFRKTWLWWLMMTMNNTMSAIVSCYDFQQLENSECPSLMFCWKDEHEHPSAFGREVLLSLTGDIFYFQPQPRKSKKPCWEWYCDTVNMRQNMNTSTLRLDSKMRHCQ